MPVVKIACPSGKRSTALESRSTPVSGSRSLTAKASTGSASKQNRLVVTG
jgi:hypothetical protein